MTARLRGTQDDGTAPMPLRQVGALATARRWVATTGAHLLVIDPEHDEQLTRDMAGRGIHVTTVSNTLDSLVEFGRTSPAVVVISPRAAGISAVDFLTTIRKHGSPFVVAALDATDQPEAGPLLCAGARAAVVKPYTADILWSVLQQQDQSLDAHARMNYGPIELDARSYTVRVGKERLADLPLKEFELLQALLYRAPEVLENDDLRVALWGADASGPADNAISVHVGRLRRRLAGVATIRRVRGRGYSLVLID